MKNNVLKIYSTLFFFCITLLAVAQPGTEDDNGTGNLEGADAPAPIDDYVLLVGIVALVIVFFKFKSLYKQHLLKN